jgi:NADP-dependent 3-hydroxy acid dehydrogenase YdfG
MVPETVVITGASAGVGRATAHAFGAQGARVGLIARGTQALQAAAAEVEKRSGEALALPLDVADPDAIEAAADSVENQFGPIDIWVNCAMATIFAPFHRITPEEYRRATEVTYLGFVYGTMAALKRMRARNRGTIVQVGPPSATGLYRCNRLIAAPNSRSVGSPTACGRNCFMTEWRCTLSWSRCRRSTRRSLIGRETR